MDVYIVALKYFYITLMDTYKQTDSYIDIYICIKAVYRMNRISYYVASSAKK